MYKLLLIGSFTPYKTYTSCEFFSYELANEFSKITDIELETCDFYQDGSNIKETDIVLIHAYPDTKAVQNLRIFKNKAKKTVYFFEHKRLNFDFCYYYSDFEKELMPNRSKFIRMPTNKSIYELIKKEPGSILLDHCHENTTWVDKLIDFFNSNKNIYPNVYQLDHPVYKSNRSNCIKYIQVSKPSDYLKDTAKFERFICTHPGSYNHTVVDMALRGTQILSPTTNTNKYWIPKCNIEDLDIKLFENEAQLHALLQKPFVDQPRIDLATDMKDVVAIMDADFRKWLSKKETKIMYL